MLIFAAIIFVVSFLLIIALFAQKMREEKTGRIVFSAWRKNADREALHFKDLINAAGIDLKKVPPLLVHAARVTLHFAALEFARAARNASRQAHRLADFVSHKHNFERVETRSEFLKKMSERKNAPTPDESLGRGPDL